MNALLAAALIILFAVFVAAPFFMTLYLLCPGRVSCEKALARLEKAGVRCAEFADCREEFTVPFEKGLLKGELLIPPGFDGRNILVFMHGFHFNRAGGYKYADFFLSAGYAVVLFDNRGCGESGGKFCTFGYREKDDLLKVVSFIKKRFPGVRAGLMGESMGASTVLSALDECGAEFAVAESAFASLTRQIRHNMNRKRLPGAFFCPLCSLWARLLAGFSFKQVSPEDDVAALSGAAPVLFIHGDGDEFVKRDSTECLFELYRGPKKVYYPESAGHVSGAVDCAEEYGAQISAFIKKLPEK